MSQIRIELLGAPRLLRDGRPVEVDTRKAIALLAYLVITGVPHTRDSLAALFYPDSDQERARGALRRTLSSLRSAIGDEALTIEREMLGVIPGSGLTADVAEFLGQLATRKQHSHPAQAVCLACLEPLQAAAALYRGDFLAGFTLRDSPAFDDWQFHEAERLRREYAGVLRHLSDIHVQTGQFEAALEAARRWLALDPLQEAAHQQIMQILAWSGQRTAALRQYRECVRILDRELGVAPLEETTRLYQRIAMQGTGDGSLEPPKQAERAAEKSPQPIPQNRPGTAFVSEENSFLMVGREQEMALLQEIYQAIAARKVPPKIGSGRMAAPGKGAWGGRAAWVVIEGESGVGKTRLAQAFVDAQHGLGAKFIHLKCYPGEENLAFAPLIEGLRSAIYQDPAAGWRKGLPAAYLSEAARLLPELSPVQHSAASQTHESPGSQTRFYESLAQVIGAILAGEKPGILWIDDLHQADEATLHLVAYLARRLDSRGILLLTTWQENHARQRPYSLVLARMADDIQQQGAPTAGAPSLAYRIALKRLTLENVTSLLAHFAPGGKDEHETMAKRLFEETEGLPSFVVEYLSSPPAPSTVSGINGIGNGIPAGNGIPVGVRSRLMIRLTALDDTSRQMLQAAAVIGRSFDDDLLRTASGRSEEETVTAIETLLKTGLIQENREAYSAAASPTYTFTHVKMRDLVYEETTLVRRRLLHRRVAAAWEKRSFSEYNPNQIGYAQIARHFELAGEAGEAATYYALAGDHARSLFANQNALAHYQAALALRHPDPARLHLACGDLQTLLGQYDQALASYETAAALASPDQEAQIEYKIGALHARRGNWGLGQEHFEIALQILSEESEPGFRAEILAHWALAAFQTGSQEAAQHRVQAALELAVYPETGATPETLKAPAYVRNVAGILAYHAGNHPQASAYLQQSLEIATRMNQPGGLAAGQALAAALNNLAYPAAAEGRLEDALGYVHQALALCQKEGDVHREAALLNHLADLYHSAQQPEQAMRYLKQAVSLFAEIGGQAGALQPEIWKLTEW